MYIYGLHSYTYSSLRLLSPSSGLSPSPLLLVPSPGLRGGKGGLGSQLKAIGIKVNVDPMFDTYMTFLNFYPVQN